MRVQRVASENRHQGQVGSIKPALISMACFGIFSLGVGIAIFGLPTNEPATETQKANDLKATVKTFEVDTSGIVSGQSIGISGQLRVNNTLVLSPSAQPAQTTAGQIYYDETANEIRYYDGSSFQGLVSSSDLEAVVRQQPAVQQPVAASGAQSITNVTQQYLTQQTINNYDTANGAAIQTDNNTFSGTNTFTAASSFADISVEDFTASGSAALQGSLTVTGTTLLGPASASSLLLSSALNVASGGTGRSSFNSNEIVIGQGTGALSSIANGAAGLCLMSTSGAPSFQACPAGSGSAGVSSLAGLTGDLLLSNSSTSGSTITIDSATSTNRGLASFNATNLTVTSGSVNTIQDIAVTAAPTFAGLTVNGTVNGQTISSTANFTGSLTVGGIVTANTISPTGSMVIGANGQNLTLQGNSSTSLSASNGANKTTLNFVAPSANVTYRLQAAAAGTYDVCTSVGNCAGAGGGVTTTGGTSGALAKFNGSQTLVDSLLSESGATVSVNGTLAVNTITPTAAMTIGSNTQSLILQGDGSTRLSAQLGGITNSLLFSAPSGSNKSIVLPNASGTVAVSASGPLAIDANGNITCASCTTSGGGSGGAVDSLNGINGAVLLNNASVAGSTITINNATTGAKGIASFNSTNFSVSSGAVNTIQDISVSSSPTFNALTLSTPLAVTSGGTGASTAAGARSNLGAASSGANTDITSLGGLTTALSVSQGGTGATNSQAAINTLSQLTTNGDLMYFNGSNSTRLARGGTGECLTSSATSIAWSSCGPGEADTLSTVTSRGATTNTGVFLQGGATSRGLTIDTATATDDKITVSVSTGGASSFTGQITAADLTATRTWTLPDASGTFCLQGSTSCGFLTGSASNYIQNQNASQQATSNFWVSGTGRADVALQAPSFDTATSMALTIGGTNATLLNLNQNTVLAASKSLVVTGGATGTRPASPTEGMVYFDTTTKQLITYANGKWQGDRSTSTSIVGMGATTGCSGSVPVASKTPDSADYVVSSCTSAQTVINNAITALPAGGGTIYLMEGTYIIDGTITLTNNVRLVGSGPGTIIKLKDGINASVNAVSNTSSSAGLVLENLILDGNKANNSSGSQQGVYVFGGGSVTQHSLEISGVTVKNFRNNGLDLWTSNYTSITNSHFLSNTGSGISATISTNDVTISGNNVASNTGVGIFANGSSIAVSGNTITSNGIGVQMNSDKGSVTGNSIRSSTGTGIEISSSRIGITVSGNAITGGSAAGIYVSTNASHNTVSGNTITSNAGIGIQLGIGANYNIISSNKLHDNGGTGSSSHIEIDGSYNNISDNLITDTAGTGAAIAIITFGYTPIQTTLSNNTFSGTGATTISDAVSTTIYNNQPDANGNIINRGTSGLAVGALAASSTLTVQGGYVGQALSAPAQPTVVTQGTAGSTSYTYAVTAFDGFGETTTSTVRVIATGNATLTGANFNRITWTRVSGAVSYKVYRTASGGTPATTGLIGTVAANAALQLDDTGIAGTGTTPASNTTGGLSVASNIQGANATLTGGLLTVGTAAQQGSLVISDGSSNTGTIQVSSLAGNYTYTIPVTTGNDTFCMLVTANCGGVSTIGALDGGTANSTGATITGSTLFLQSASGTNPGVVNTGTQTFAGNKTFTGTLSVQNTTVGAGTSITFVGGITSTRPATPAEGMVYFDTTTKQLITYANGKWQGDRSANTKVVAASNSSQSARDAADYVATGTNDQAQINSALTAAAGGTVYLMEGTYTVNTAIIVPDNTTLSGAGRGTLIRLADIDVSANAIQNSGSGKIIIRDLRIDGQKSLNTAGTQHGIYLNGMGATAPGPSVENVEISNFRTNGVELDGTDNSTITNVISTANNVGFYVYPFSDWNQLSKVTAQSNVSNGISFTNGTNNSLRDSLSKLNGGNGIITGSDNQVIESSSFISNTASGIRLNSNSNRVVDNVIRSNTGNGIYLDGSDVQINSNEISSNGSTGIYMPISVGNNKITNNSITSNTGNGIDGSRNNHNMQIVGNYVKSNTLWGIELSGYIYQLISNENVSNNTVVSNASGGIQLWSASSSNVAGNTLIDNGGATTNNGISIGNTYSGNNNVANNSITDTSCTTNCYAISINGTDNQVSSNTIGDGILVDFAGANIYGRGEIQDNGTNTIYVNQRDTNGNLLNRGGGGLSVNTNTVTSSLTLQGGLTNSRLPTPSQPTVATAGTAGTTTYGYKVTALDGTGETLPSTERTIATGNATLNSTNYNVITWPQVSGAVQYKVYRTTSAGTPATTGLIATITGANNVFFNDTGIAAGVAAPVANTTGGVTVAGNIQGSNASLTGTLAVTGATTLNGAVTATNTILFKNTADSNSAFILQDSASLALFTADTSAKKITIRTLDVTLNLTVAGHIISDGTTPSIAADTAACTTPTVSVSGTDTAGTITVTTGTGCAAPGNISTVTFSTAFGVAPKVTLTPASAAAAGLNAYLDDATISTASFKVGVANTPADSTVYKWNYHAVQ